MNTYRFNQHNDANGIWCRWSGVSVSRLRACPFDCPDSHAELINDTLSTAEFEPIQESE